MNALVRNFNIALALSLLSTFTAIGADIYVDKNGSGNYTDIQSAINNAQPGDTVWVLPGEYDSGGWVDNNGFTNRVYINKSCITIKATSSNPNDTHIVGAWDENGDEFGRGPAAVRGIYIDELATNTVVQGFTIRNCATPSKDSVAAGGMAGATVTIGGTTKNNWYADCTFIDNAGFRGINAYGGIFLRCRFDRAYAGDLMQEAIAIHSLFVNIAPTLECGTKYLINGGKLYNCTFYNCQNDYFAPINTNGMYNCLLAGSARSVTYSAGKVTLSNSIIGPRTDGYKISTSDSDHLILENSSIVDSNVQFLAPAFENYRLVAGSAAINVGDAKHLAKFLETHNPPEGIDIYKDYTHANVPKTGAINAGCCQEVITPAAGAVFVTGADFIIDGAVISKTKYFYPEAYPTQYHATVSLNEGEDVFGFDMKYADGSNKGFWRYPLPDNSFWFMPSANASLTCDVKKATSIVYAKPGADAALADGSFEKPYPTLQAAVDNSSSYSIIKAAEGDYDKGYKYEYAMTNRVVIDKPLRLLGAGAQKSYIWGKADDSGIYPDGIGTNAIRCIAAASGSLGCVQGFTIINGHAGRSALNDKYTQAEDYAGGIRGNGAVTVADCIVSNCIAYRGGAGYQTPFIRTIITCSGYGSGRIVENSSSKTTGCVFMNCLGKDGRPFENGNQTNPISDAMAIHTTVIVANKDIRPLQSGHNTLNCIVNGGTTPSTSWAFQNEGLFIPHAWSKMPTADKDNINLQHFIIGDIRFVDPQNADCRLMATSEAIGKGTYTDDMYKWYEPLMDGPIVFTNGKPTPGAYQRPVPVIITPTETSWGSLSLIGTNAVEEGESISLTINNLKRPLEGFMVGETFIEGTSYTVTIPNFGIYGSTYITEILPVYGTNWYVNAAMPTDDGDGFTPKTAKKTLKGIMECSIISGDRIHAAQGDYNTEILLATNISYKTSTIGTRVVIPSGVTLISDEGPDVTFITGCEAPEEIASSYNKATGLGEGAVRCVYMYENSHLNGFTIRGGRTNGEMTNDASNPDCYGGGLIVRDGGLIENCIITNCAGRRCGGSCGGTFVRCKFIDNKNDVIGSWGDTFTVKGIYNCYFDYNDTYVSVRGYPMANCLIGPNNTHSYSVYCYTDPGSTIINTICCKQLRHASTSGFLVPTNVYCTGLGGTTTNIITDHLTVCTLDTILSELDIDNGYKFKGIDSKFVDAGSSVALDHQHMEKDLEGGQRVYNCKIDIGPWEYDYRSYFASRIGGVTVEEASANVTTNEIGQVRLLDGASIALTPLSPDARRLSMNVENGELSAEGGIIPETFSSASTYKFKPPATLYLSFAGAGGYADVLDIINKPGYSIILR
ncbi:MAG: hypothetical protein J6R80_04465 [Kiritimatiellae bacterium]|nr:hypothetical protein [Kiritimatiellia bacterium]